MDHETLNWMLCAASIAWRRESRLPFARPGRLRVATRPRGPTRLFFSISSQYFHRDRQNVATGAGDSGILTISPSSSISSSGRSPARAGLRASHARMSWYEVGMRCGVPFNAWYVTYNGRPSGRYSRPYGYYDRNRQDPQFAARLSDREIRDLVAVRMAHEYYGVTPQTAMDWRRNGSNVQVIMTREYDHHRRDRDAEYSRYEGHNRQYPRMTSGRRSLEHASSGSLLSVPTCVLTSFIRSDSSSADSQPAQMSCHPWATMPTLRVFAKRQAAEQDAQAADRPRRGAIPGRRASNRRRAPGDRRPRHHSG